MTCLQRLWPKLIGCQAFVRSVSPGRKNRLEASLPTKVLYRSESLPFALEHLPKRAILKMVVDYLPTYGRAAALAEAYLTHLSCFFRPVQRDQIVKELFPRYYKHREDAFTEDECGVSVHHLALLFAILAVGAAGDLVQEAHNDEGDLYCHLSRCVLSLHSIFEGTSVATVQALSLIGVYNFFSANTQTLEAPWKLLSLSFSLASSVSATVIFGSSPLTIFFIQ